MNLRRPKILFAGLALVGTTLLLVFLVASLQPNKKPAKLPLVNIAALKAGQHLKLDTDSLRYFVVHPLHGELHVVAAPQQDGAVLMPDIHWWKPLMHCKDFGIDTVDNAITSESTFRCRDAEQPEKWLHQWQWDIEGRHIAASAGEKIDNLYRVRFERDDDELRFVGLLAD